MKSFSELSLLSQIAVLESQEVQHSVDADSVEALLSISHYAWFGMEGDAETCLTEHRQVVGSVAYGNGLGEVYLFYLGYEF